MYEYMGDGLEVGAVPSPSAEEAVAAGAQAVAAVAQAEACCSGAAEAGVGGWGEKNVECGSVGVPGTTPVMMVGGTACTSEVDGVDCSTRARWQCIRYTKHKTSNQDFDQPYGNSRMIGVPCQ